MSIKVKDLLNEKIAVKYNDRLFWYAKNVQIINDSVNIYIQDDCLVTFDDINIEGVHQKVSKLSQIKQSNQNNMNDVLVSSGSFLFINDKLVITQRTANTKYDPLHWTTPAGRCDRTILETGIKETIEEISITRDNKTFFPNIAKNFISDKENVEFYETFFENKQFPLKVYNINLYLDNILIEQSKSWMYYSKEVNTLEFRIPLFAKLDEKELKFSNPEFGTDIKLISLNMN